MSERLNKVFTLKGKCTTYDNWIAAAVHTHTLAEQLPRQRDRGRAGMLLRYRGSA